MLLDHLVTNIDTFFHRFSAVVWTYLFNPNTDLSKHNSQQSLFSSKGGVQSPANPFELYRAQLLFHSSHVWFLSVICALVVLLTDPQTTHMGETGSTLLSAFFPFIKHLLTQSSDRDIS